MVAITPGSEGTFKAATAEGRAIEVLTYFQIQEQDETKNPNGRNAVTGSFNTEDNRFEGNYSFIVDQSLNPDGSISLAATSALVGVAINPGGGDPTFKSTVIERYALEVLMYLQAAERISAKNPQNLNAVTGSYNSDSGVYTGNFSLPITVSITASGNCQIAAVEYLTA